MSDAAIYADSACEIYGMAVGALVVVDVGNDEPDPRVGDILTESIRVPVPDPSAALITQKPMAKTFEELVAEADSFADLKALVLANARP